MHAEPSAPSGGQGSGRRQGDIEARLTQFLRFGVVLQRSLSNKSSRCMNSVERVFLFFLIFFLVFTGISNKKLQPFGRTKLTRMPL